MQGLGPMDLGRTPSASMSSKKQALRNYVGEILRYFSRSVTTKESNDAELPAIHQALITFKRNGEFSYGRRLKSTTKQPKKGNNHED